MSTATAVATQAASANTRGRIYLNKKLSEYFGLDYMNEGQRTVIHCNALDRACDTWEDDTQAIIDQGGDLKLEGDGYGWWNIVG
jgi:hypothetical protein